MSSPLNFHLEQYDGPLDLLLDLIRKQQINISDIPIARITQQYLEYMQQAAEMNIELSAEFVYMAATLIQIKSRMLLPRDPELDKIAPEEDPRQELVERLLEHERFKAAAEMLQEKRVVEDQKKMRAVYDTVTPDRLWDGKFRLPLKDVTTGGNFGRQRILNGQARSPHSGVDFPAAAGTPVFASQSGKVVLAEELYYSGNTVVIDHGYGIYTMYCHLSKIGVAAGDAIKAGDELGKVGATGRVTGPHLHWALTIQHARVNGMQIVARQP